MAEFSLWTRFFATLLLVALSVAAWKWLHGAPVVVGGSPAKASSTTSSKSKKKTKKRAAKKASAAALSSGAATAGGQDNPARARSTQDSMSADAKDSAKDEHASDSDDDSDSDEGLSAVQILAKRKFKVKAIGAVATKHAGAIATPNAPKYELNQRVLARFEGGPEWFPATILEIRRGNEYHVKYDDGEIEYHVPHALIKSRDAEPTPTSPKSASTTDPNTSREPQRGEQKLNDAAAHASESDDDDDDEESGEEDDWEMVGATSGKSKGKKPFGAAANAMESPIQGDGLTKRQRENRRKKERQKEIKELARAQAQENGLHAKWGGTYSKMKYVAPPKQA